MGDMITKKLLPVIFTVAVMCTTALATIEAEDYDAQSGIQTETCDEGGQNIGYIENGDWSAYDNVDFGGGAEEFQARVASDTTGGNIEIRLDSLTGTLLGTCPVTNTGDWQNWETNTVSISAVSGVHDVYLVYTGVAGGYLFNLNWFALIGPPSAPIGLFATSGYGSVVLDWVDNGEPDLASYSVYRSSVSGGPYVNIASGIATSEYVDSTAINDITYYYVVTAVDTDNNESGYSIEEPAMAQSSFVATIEAEDYDARFGIDTETCDEGGQNIGWIENGDWSAYDNVDFDSGVEEFQARVASDTAGGNIEIRLDSPTGTLVGTCPVANTGSWQTWVTNTVSVSGASGVHDLYLVYTGGAGYLFNVNWFSFTYSDPGLTPPTPNPMTWKHVPYGSDSTSISMEATTAIDRSGVQYYFTCTSGGGNDSGWQASPTYTDTGLLPATIYAYTVKARDLSTNFNETAQSSEVFSHTELPTTLKLEAEDAVLYNRAAVYTDASASGGQAVEYLNRVGDAIEFTDVPAAIELKVVYCSQQTGTHSLLVNGQEVMDLNFTSNENWNTVYQDDTYVVSIPDKSTIRFSNEVGDSGWNVDYIELTLAKPGDLNTDGKINLEDFAYLSSKWLETPGYDLYDLMVLSETWLNVDEPSVSVPDFSYCGYQTTGEQNLPDYAMSTYVQSSVAGDDWATIQAAVDEVASWAPDGNGYRGVVSLPDAEYEVSQPIEINTSGVVIQGGGMDVTTVTATWTNYRGNDVGVFHFEGSSDPIGAGGEYSIIEDREPGNRSLNIGSNHDFVIGDSIWVICRPTEAWTDLLGVTEIWGGSELPEMERRYKRTVTGVSGSTIDIDAPLVDPIDSVYVPGSVQRYSWTGVVENVGIKDLTIDSVYASDTDENHAWTGVYFNNAQDGFVDRVDGLHLAYAAVYCDVHANRITVIDSNFRLPISAVEGSRRYGFTTRGQLCFFRRCYTSEARHGFSCNTGSAGPNAFVDCSSKLDTSETGPYHRWNPGVLFDGCTSEVEIATRDRLEHTSSLKGWTGASIVFYNCEAPTVVMGTPPGLDNWAYGCIETAGDGVIDTEGSTGTTTIESTGMHVQTVNGFDSLYDQQCYTRGLFSLLEITQNDVLNESVTLVEEFSAEAWDLLIPDQTYTPLATFNGATYLVWVNADRKPRMTKIVNGAAVQTEPLSKYDDYQTLDNGHHKYSLGIDNDGYIHVTGDMHGYPQSNTGHMPEEYQNGYCMYWVSDNPEDISSFTFAGGDEQRTIKGTTFTYNYFDNDNNGVLFYAGRQYADTDAGTMYGRFGYGMSRYDTETKTWTALGEIPPGGTHKVILWEDDGQYDDGKQSFRGDIRFDKNNRMHFTVPINSTKAGGNQNVVYAYSDDLGDSWYKADGTPIANLPMRVEDGADQADVLVDVTSGIAMNASVAFDKDTNPFVYFQLNNVAQWMHWDGGSWSDYQELPIAATWWERVYNDGRGIITLSSRASNNFYRTSGFGVEGVEYNAPFFCLDRRYMKDTGELRGLSNDGSTMKVVRLETDLPDPSLFDPSLFESSP